MTIYKCDRCGETFKTPGELTTVICYQTTGIPSKHDRTEYLLNADLCGGCLHEFKSNLVPFMHNLKSIWRVPK